MKLNYSETNSANLWIENGILFIKCLPDAIITRNVAEKITDERIKISKGNSYPVFMDVRNAKYITMDARNFLKQTEGLQFISAYAFLFDSHVHSVLVNYFLTINPPALPALTANKRENALNWLGNYKAEAITNSKPSFANKELAF